jgi:tetratricopeptide (TPR) repeat protein
MAQANLKSAQKDVAGALQEMQKAIQQDPGNWEFYLNYALLQLKADQPDVAEANFKKAISLNPGATSAELSLGAFYQQRSRFAEAEQAFRHAMENDAKNPEPRAALSRLWMSQGKKAETEQLLQKTKLDLPNNSAGYRMLGDYYFASGDLDRAVTEYESLYQQHPRDVLVKKNYIQLLILKNRIDEAGKLNNEVLKENAADPEALVYRGQLQIRRGQFSEAAETLQQALQGNRQSGVAHYHLGVAFDQMGNQVRAENEWREASRLSPELPEVQRALAAAELRRGDWSALAQTAEHLISLQPSLPDGYALRAISENNRHQAAKAEDDLQKAMEIAPQSPVGYIHMGNLRAQQKQYADAQKYYEQALQHDPNAADALNGIINLYLEQKQPDKAIARVQAQLSTQPNNSNYHYLLGAVYSSKKDWKAAETELKRAAELDNNNADAVIKLGQVLTAQGAIDQALSTYQNFSQRSPRDVRFYILTGELYESQKNWERAKDVYQKALQIQPDNALASNNLAYVMLEQGGNVDVALSMAQSARRALPESPNVADTLGWAYYHKGAYGSALDLFKEALKLNKDNADDPTLHYHLGLAYQKTSQPGLAKQQFERALKINPSFSYADETRKLLAQ